MKIKHLIALCFVAVLSGCKNDKKTEGVAAKPSVKENFSIELDAVAAKKDDFALYYTEDNTLSFDEKRVSWKGVTGGNVDEKITFELSSEIVPTDIRLDFGLNKLQESVEIKNIKIIYYGNEMNIKGADFFYWFIKDEKFKTEIDAVKGSLKIVKSGNEWITPFYYPKQELIDALKKLVTIQN